MWAIGILLVSDEVVRRALGITALLAFVVQLVAFAIARAYWVKKQNVMAGWGIGIALRFAALVLFGLIGVPRLGLGCGPPRAGDVPVRNDPDRTTLSETMTRLRTLFLALTVAATSVSVPR